MLIFSVGTSVYLRQNCTRILGMRSARRKVIITTRITILYERMSFNDSTNSQHMNHLRTGALYKSSNEFTRGHVFYDMNEKRIVCLFFFFLSLAYKTNGHRVVCQRKSTRRHTHHRRWLND